MSAEPPAKLFHYTSSAGLIGMLGEEQFWLTSIHYLNDSKEYSLACDYLLTAINTAKREKSLADDYAALLERITTSISKLDLCVMSFCEDGDSLSLWRGYCPQGGYSIGIESNFLKSLVDRRTKNGEAMRLEKCEYDNDRHSTWANEIVAEMITKYPTGAKAGIPAIAHYANTIMKHAPLIKHPSFKEEREWRLCVQPSSIDKFTFRAGRSFLIPYVKMRLRDEPMWKASVKQVFIGPTPNLLLSKTSLTTFLSANSYGSCAAHESKVPYRTW